MKNETHCPGSEAHQPSPQMQQLYGMEMGRERVTLEKPDENSISQDFPGSPLPKTPPSKQGIQVRTLVTHVATKSLHASTKTQHNQINNKYFKKLTPSPYTIMLVWFVHYIFGTR